MAVARKKSTAANRLLMTKTIVSISSCPLIQPAIRERVPKSVAILAAFIGASYGLRREPDKAQPPLANRASWDRCPAFPAPAKQTQCAEAGGEERKRSRDRDRRDSDLNGIDEA